jgi:hypothetical protein
MSPGQATAGAGGLRVAVALGELKSDPIWSALWTNGQTEGTPEADQLRTLKQAVLRHK